MTNGDTPRARGRPKKDRRQSSFNDIPIEDGEIANLLEEIDAGETIALRVRQAKAKLKKLVEAGYSHVINSDQDGDHSGYVICDRFRFWAGVTEAPERQQLAKKISARRTWQPLDVHRVDLFSAAGVE